MESAQAQKLERQLAKVERKRWTMQILSAVQIGLGPPYTVWILLMSSGSTERSILASFVAAIGILWSIAGCTGLYAVAAHHVQVCALRL